MGRAGNHQRRGLLCLWRWSSSTAKNSEDVNMNYKLRDGGPGVKHAPGVLRDALLEWLGEDEFPATTVDVDGVKKPVDWLFGKLWHCTDCLPASYAEQIEM